MGEQCVRNYYRKIIMKDELSIKNAGRADLAAPVS